MSLVSTFELLLKPQLPASVTSDFPQLQPLSRVILQGYFLTVSNVSGRDLSLLLSFQTRTPGLKSEEVLCFQDDDGIDTPLAPTQVANGPGRSTRFTFTLDNSDTTLILLQPNIIDETLLANANFEARGFVELYAQPGTASANQQVLVNAEHRGTFFDPSTLVDMSSMDPSSVSKASLGEIAYPLELASGSSLLKLDRPD